MAYKKRIMALIMVLLLIAAIIASAAGCAKKTAIVPDTNKAEPQQNPSVTPAAETGPVLYTEFDKAKEYVKVPFKAAEYKASVPAYKVNADLSNIENLAQYGGFTEVQKQMLVQNGFLVTPSDEEQLFYVYEQNEYLKVPSFVTTDSVLQVYHVFYDYSLRRLETDKLYSELSELTASMLKKSIAVYGRLENERLKVLQLKNVAYFGVAELALNAALPEEMPAEARKLAEEEYQLVKGQGSYQRSRIFPFDLDYSQYKPRGHYTRSEELKEYFTAMMWYGQVPFPAYKSKALRNEEQTLQALMLTYGVLLEDKADLTRWRNIYEPTAFYVGSSDDLNILDYRELLLKVYGEKPDINKLDDKEKLDELYKEIDKLPEPAISAKYTKTDAPSGKQFRFMGQRYVADSEILQELVEPIKRPIPMGLDLMGVLGSKRAEDLLINVYEEQKKWNGYKTSYDKQKERFGKLSESTWQSNMYFGWLWSFKGLLREYGEGYPTFMQTKAWQDKSLNTALGSWSELKHDTVLYGKGVAAECGGEEEEPPKLKSYVEPSIQVYERLQWLTKYSRENLRSRDILDGELESKMVRFEELLQFLTKCSVKELDNEKLSEDEELQLLYIGGWLESLTNSFVDSGLKLRQMESEADRNMALISDIHTVVGEGCLEVGVGPANQIYVIVPVGGKLYLTRGAVFSYYEFMSKDRLTDEEWKKKLKSEEKPAQQNWMKSFIDSEKKEEVPVPAEPYSTGC